MSINYITVKTLDELPEVAGKKHIDVSDSFDAMMLDGPDAHWETEDIEDQKDDKGMVSTMLILSFFIPLCT